MDGVLIKCLLVLVPVGVVLGEPLPHSSEDAGQAQDVPRYIVFPGLDAGEDEVEEWSYGFASPFNVFFGPKPYVLGWVGEAPFGPTDEEGEYDVDYEEDEEEGEEEEEEAIGDYDYEKTINRIKHSFK